MAWDLENSVALGREGTGLATIIKQPSLKELTTSPYAAAAKKAASTAKPDTSQYNDLNGDIASGAIYERDIDDIAKSVNDFQEKRAALLYKVANQKISQEDAHKEHVALQKEKNTILSNINISKQDNISYNKDYNTLSTSPHKYEDTDIELFKTETQKPISDRQRNYHLPQGNTFNYAKYMEDLMGSQWETWSKGSFTGKGGGSSKTRREFDEAKARTGWQDIAAANANTVTYHKILANAADVMQKEYNKDANLQKQYAVIDWFDLSDDVRAELSEKKAEDIAVGLSKNKFTKMSKDLSRGDREKDGGGGGTANAGKGFYEVKTSWNTDGTFNKTQIINLNVVAGKTSVDTTNPANYFVAENGSTISNPIHPTGRVIKKQEGIWMVEVEALEKFTDPITKKTINVHDKFEIPYEQNKKVLQKYGYQSIDEIKSPEERKNQYDISEPAAPSEFNKTTTDPKKRDAHKANYDKWKASGWKNTSIALNKMKAEDAVNDQVANLSNQEKKVGTYNPLTGQIDFA